MEVVAGSVSESTAVAVGAAVSAAAAGFGLPQNAVMGDAATTTLACFFPPLGLAPLLLTPLLEAAALDFEVDGAANGLSVVASEDAFFGPAAPPCLLLTGAASAAPGIAVVEEVEEEEEEVEETEEVVDDEKAVEAGRFVDNTRGSGGLLKGGGDNASFPATDPKTEAVAAPAPAAPDGDILWAAAAEAAAAAA